MIRWLYYFLEWVGYVFIIYIMGHATGFRQIAQQNSSCPYNSAVLFVAGVGCLGNCSRKSVWMTWVLVLPTQPISAMKLSRVLLRKCLSCLTQTCGTVSFYTSWMCAMLLLIATIATTMRGTTASGWWTSLPAVVCRYVPFLQVAYCVNAVITSDTEVMQLNWWISMSVCK